MPRRWPVRPVPYSGEALSSWINRLADALGASSASLLQEEFGIPARKSNRYALDFDPPEYLITGLAERTGQPVSAIRALTARGYVPGLLDHLEIASYGLNTYTQGLSCLLPYERRKARKGRMLPWYAVTRFREPQGCRACLLEDKEPYLRLRWRFSWMVTCPVHNRVLEQVSIVGPNWGRTQVVWREPSPDLRPIPPILRAVEAITLQAIQGNACELPCGTIPGDLWLRLLRTILEELSIGPTSAGPYRRRFEARWNNIGLPYRNGMLGWRPYESMDQRLKDIFMYLAAVVLREALQGDETAGLRIMEMSELHEKRESDER